MTASLGVFLPMPLTGLGVSHTCVSLAQGMADEELAVTIVTPRADRRLVPSADVIEVLPWWTRSLPYRWVRNAANRNIDSVFLSEVESSRSRMSAACIWPDAKAETIRELKRRDVLVFREMINCHTGTAKVILDEAYARIGVAPSHGITAETVEAEKESLAMVDYIFCPSPQVAASLEENGVPSSKLLDASFGWDPARFATADWLPAPVDGITAVFVGTICVRKGSHLLLDYWAQSGVKGRLVLAGEMEATIKERCADLLNRDGVVVRDYSRDIAALYRSADIFVLPTFEEGSPLVIYEALGCGVPVLTTPMGAGRIVRHKSEGFVIEPYDRDGWIAAIRTLAEDVELRRSMGRAAAERAQSFVWNSVAARRRRHILERLGRRVESV